jgi:hypothetical protein
LYVLGRDFVNLGKEGIKVALMAMMQITPAEVEGKLFPVVTGDGYLSLYLPLGRRELCLGEWFLHQPIQFLANQLPTLVDIVMVASEIGTP